MTAKTSKRILILTATLGSGHLRAAEAIQSALQFLDPACVTKIVDIKPLISPFLRFFNFHGYEFLIEHASAVWRWLYRSSWVRHGKYAAPSFLLKHGNSRLLREVKSFAPDVIVSTQINCHELSYFLCFHLAPLPQRLAVITDYDVHPVWSKLPCDLWVVAHPDLAKQLVELGLDRLETAAFGIPIDLVFKKPLDRAGLMARMGLNPDRRTILLMGGSVGFGELHRVVNELLKSKVPLQILAIAAKNERVRAQLEQIRLAWEGVGPLADRSVLHVFGFVKNVPEFMSVADCFITKPGGLATSEALVKKLPMLFVNPIAGHEERNSDFFVRHGAAVSIRELSELLPAIESLFQPESHTRMEMNRAAWNLAKPNAAVDLAEWILHHTP
ncbi:MAG: glycosyltransferase [Acidobacteriia bacterium]|nr:glycosyltransferase [Terriglobia bacterium]